MAGRKRRSARGYLSPSARAAQSAQRLTIEIELESLDIFFGCLGIGVLTAIQRGYLPASAGIWTLGNPNVGNHINAHPVASRELAKVFGTFDEVSSIRLVASTAYYEDEIESLIQQLGAVVNQSGTDGWVVYWHNGGRTPDDLRPFSR